jgi:glycosyltransferase involved in cell wall biosynthesis
VIAALDATPLTLTSGGLARYVTELSRALAVEYPEDSYVLLSDQRFAVPAGAPPNLIAKEPRTNIGRWWLQGVRRVIAEAGVQIFHGTNFEVPYRGNTPSVLTIHDLSPWRDPGWHQGAARVRLRTPWLIRLRRASLILTVSQAVRREIIGYFQVAEERVRAIPLAASGIFRPVARSIAPENPYFLYVGTLEPRKNLKMLAEVWPALREQTGAEFVIAGRTRADFVPFPDLAGIKMLGEVPDRELPSLYSGALAFVYPTLYEGFGLPVLEAMQCGCPVITSRDPAVTEVSGGAAIHAGSAAELAEAMRALASNPEKRNEKREKGLARATQFSWQRTARATHDLYSEVLAGARRV